MDGTTASNNGVEQVVAYLRISEDRTGAEAGVERQRQDCLDLCARLGITDPAIFIDNDISAYSGKKRPGYIDLLDRVKLGPSRIVAWHVDRLYRRPASWKTSSTSWRRIRSGSRRSRAVRST